MRTLVLMGMLLASSSVFAAPHAGDRIKLVNEGTSGCEAPEAYRWMDVYEVTQVDMTRAEPYRLKFVRRDDLNGGGIIDSFHIWVTEDWFYPNIYSATDLTNFCSTNGYPMTTQTVPAGTFDVCNEAGRSGTFKYRTAYGYVPIFNIVKQVIEDASYCMEGTARLKEYTFGI